jgi:hypothetical protein
MKTDKTESMWPEKINAIYEQFPWLRKLVHENNVTKAYVKRFDKTTLELAKIYDNLWEDEIPNLINHIWLLNIDGSISRTLGNIPRKYITWFGLGKEKTYVSRGVNETVRSALQKLPEADQSTYLVFFQKGELTIFKPPQKGVTIKQWYDEQVCIIKKQITKEIEEV